MNVGKGKRMPVIQFYAEQRRNLVKSFVLICLFVALMGAFGYLVDSLFGITPWATAIFLAIALIQILVGVLSGPAMVLSSLGAKPIRPEDEAEHRELSHIVQELCVASASPPPKIYYLPQERAINAFATGLRKDRAYVCVTQGLLDALDREETQGVLVHEMSHILNRDMLYMTLLSAILGAMVIVQVLAFSGLRGAFSFNDSDDLGGCLTISLFLIVVGVLSTIFSFIGRIVVLAISRQREYLADAKAVEFTRNPYGLARALRVIAGGNRQVQAASIATAHLFISDPLDRSVNEREGFWANLFSTHPPMVRRIARLEGIPLEAVKLDREETGQTEPPLESLAWMVGRGSKLSEREIVSLVQVSGLAAESEEAKGLRHWGDALKGYREDPSEDRKHSLLHELQDAGIPTTRVTQILKQAVATDEEKSPEVPADAIRVEADGSGMAHNLAEACRSAADGATVFLGSGFHLLEAPMLLERPVHLLGAGKEKTRISYAGSDAAIQCKGIEFHAQGLSFEHGAVSWGSVLVVEDGSLVLEQCRFSGGRLQHQDDIGGSGLVLTGGASGTITSCEMSGNEGSGLVLGGRTQIKLERSLVRGNGRAGIVFVGVAGGEVRGNKVQANRGVGILVSGNSVPILEENCCQANAGAGILYRDHATGTARGNRVQENEDGFFLDQSAAPSLEANDASGNRRDGIRVEGQAQPNVVGNKVEGNAQVGIRFLGEAAGRVKGNRFARNGRGDLKVEGQAHPEVER
jgi:heat shock protein HtpX